MRILDLQCLLNWFLRAREWQGNMLNLIAKLFLGKGIDKKLPFLVDWYKAAFLKFSKAGETEVEIPMGLKMLVSDKDAGLGLFLRLKKGFEPQQTKLFVETVKRNQTVVDIGANVGIYTLMAAKLVGKNGMVYAFEPDPDNFKLLEKNVKLNGFTNVRLVNAAVADKTGTLAFAQDRANPGESHIGNGKLQVQAVRLADWLKKEKVEKINVIKMDIEGAEVSALTGMVGDTKTFLNTKLFAECNSKALAGFGKQPIDLVEAMKNIGWKPTKVIDEFAKKTTSFNPMIFRKALARSSYVTLYAEK